MTWCSTGITLAISLYGTPMEVFTQHSTLEVICSTLYGIEQVSTTRYLRHMKAAGCTSSQWFRFESCCITTVSSAEAGPSVSIVSNSLREKRNSIRQDKHIRWLFHSQQSCQGGGKIVFFASDQTEIFVKSAVDAHTN